jgi:gamma-glutamylcyclotransferase (GGCT)/AIG2-like uncharacterized protein YtfP
MPLFRSRSSDIMPPVIQRLFVYGTLKPGHANAHLLEAIGGTWQPASVVGTLHPEGWGAGQGYPALVLDETGSDVRGVVFTSERLPQHWQELDEFEVTTTSACWRLCVWRMALRFRRTYTSPGSENCGEGRCDRPSSHQLPASPAFQAPVYLPTFTTRTEVFLSVPLPFRPSAVNSPVTTTRSGDHLACIASLRQPTEFLAREARHSALQVLALYGAATMAIHSFNLSRPGLAAILATVFSVGTCMAATAPDQCIVGESVFGCRSERDIARITAASLGNPEALREMIAVDLSSGVCQIFQEGERVYSTGSATNAERTAVRRSGDDEAYWMPATWSRPVEECRAYPVPRSIAGNSTTAAAPASDGTMSVKATRGPSFASQMSVCIFKPVMSDAEIAACKSSPDRD